MSIQSNNWMSNLPDNLKLNEFTIPGTHDTCAYSCSVFGKCQYMSLMDQLNAGVRYLDIRCRHINDTFKLHHHSVNLRIDFDLGVLDTCVNFLKSNPSEVLIMLVSTEYTPKNNKCAFDDVFVNYINPIIDYWYLDEHIPDLRSSRGKIVLLRRFYSRKKPLGIDMSGWRDNQTFTMNNHSDFSFVIQDEYKLYASTKWTRFKQLAVAAAKTQELYLNQECKTVWYLNYCSAQSWPVQPPSYIAWSMNSKLSVFIKSMNNVYSLGVVILDFAYPELIELIYMINFSKDDANNNFFNS